MIKLKVCKAFLGIVFLWTLTGCNAKVPTWLEAATPTSSPAIQLQPCDLDGYAAQCGTLSVFEDRAAQSGRRIELRVAVIKAYGKEPSSDPIFWFAGGPGGAATEDVSYAREVLKIAIQQRDLVLVDQRGTGGSNNLVCPKPVDPSRQVQDLRACLEHLDGDPSMYTTAWAVDDVDDVRAALGYDQINLYGGSYGATAAQVYILRHGEHVRTASLDGVTLLDVPIFERYPISSQQALEVMFARCKADEVCGSAFPDLKQEFEEVLARLDREPVTLSIIDTETGEPGVLTSEAFKSGIHSLLVSTSTAVVGPKFIHLVYSKDWDGLEAFLEPFLNSDDATPQWKLMSLTILCYEDWAKLRPAQTGMASTSAHSYLTYEDVRTNITLPEEVCAAMPAPKADALYGPVTNSSVPVLLFNGEADPQDPPANVTGSIQRYPNSLSLVAPGQGHGFTGIPCRASIVADFVEQGSVDGLSTQCLQEVALPEFAR